MSTIEYKVTVTTFENGKKSVVWKLNGQYHREDGPAVISPDGTEKWLVNGKLHRIDGPAVIQVNGGKQWWIDGKLHREDGPAIVTPDGREQWWIDGKEYTESTFNTEIARRRNPIQELTVAEISKRLGYEVKIVKE